MRRVFVLALTLAALAPPRPAFAQEEAPDASPRATWQAFMDAARHRNWKEAAVELDSEGRGPASADLPARARQLKAVLDSYLFINPDDLSDQPQGRLDDHLPPDEEQIGRVPAARGRGTSPVRMLRLPTGRWVFSPATVARVPAWYARLPDRWMRDHLPQRLLAPGPRDVFWWQYIALFLLAVFSLAVGAVVQLALRWLLRRGGRRTGAELNKARLRRLRGPLSLFVATVVAPLFLSWLLLTKPAEAFVTNVLSAARLVSLYWFLIKAIELGADRARGSKFMAERAQSGALIPLASRAAKVALSIVAVVVFLQKLGYPAASLIAGLGIGGLAFALAAQKTVENLFGSVMLSVDQPFRPGDLIKLDTLMGVVETVGLRSTRVRTPDRTTVTIPNGRLADMNIESFATRDRLKFATTVSVVYGTTAAQLGRIMDELKLALETHPKRHPEDVRVALAALGATSIDIEVLAWFATTDWNEFVALRQQMLLAIMEIVARHGSDFAFPTQTLHIATVPGGK